MKTQITSENVDHGTAVVAIPGSADFHPAKGASRNALSIQHKTGLLTMNKLTLALKNCYGIKRLNHKFDFSNERVYAIYAPNGVMKSSLAQTFEDEAIGATSADRIFQPAYLLERLPTKTDILTKPQLCS